MTAYKSYNFISYELSVSRLQSAPQTIYTHMHIDYDTFKPNTYDIIFTMFNLLYSKIHIINYKEITNHFV